MPNLWDSESFQGDENSRVLVHPNSTGGEAPALKTLPDIALLHLFIWLFICNTIYNKQVSISDVFP